MLAFAPLEASVITKFFRPMVKGRITCSAQLLSIKCFRNAVQVLTFLKQNHNGHRIHKFLMVVHMYYYEVIEDKK